MSAPDTAREQDAPPARIAVIDYDAEHFQERHLSTPEECRLYTDSDTTTWINVAGLDDPQAVRSVAACCGAHELVIEDILNTEQRPKFDYEDGKYVFFVVKMLQCAGPGAAVVAEQVSLLLAPRLVASFQEEVTAGDVFDDVRRRLRSQTDHIRRVGADYLAYALLDAVLDACFDVMERLEDYADDLEEQLVADPRPQVLTRIYSLKRQLLVVRKAVWPLRQVIDALQRGGSPLIAADTAIYLRDIYDHIYDAIDTLETLRERVSGMLDIYLSSTSNRLNEVMKVLTIFATIFAPLTFIVGVYGMNFTHMPELHTRWGYPLVWLVSLLIAIVMLSYFRRRRWL